MKPFREEAVRILSRHTGLPPAEVDAAIVRPPKPELGDFAFPCFLLAKTLKKAPHEIAAGIAAAAAPELELLSSAQAVGPYVNFSVRRDRLAATVLHEAVRQGEAAGRSPEGEGRVVVIDYSSPNIAKPFHVGHLRSTIIGSALYRIFETLGYRPVGINHLGDWGTQFGKQIAALKRWGTAEDAHDLAVLNRLYVKFHEEEAEKEAESEKLRKEAESWSQRLEKEDREAVALWESVREAHLRHQRTAGRSPSDAETEEATRRARERFAKEMAALERWGKPEDVHDSASLERLYRKFEEEQAKGARLTDEARSWFRRQEEGDPEALALWKAVRETSLQYFQRIYDRLGVRFDHFMGESFFNDKMEEVVQRAEKKGLAEVSKGALIIPLSMHGIETPALLRKADGTTLYLTRDVAAAVYRRKTFGFHKMLYVVASAQSLHFQQLFKVLELLGEEWAKDCVHVNFGLVHGMSTRRGNVVYLEELLDEARSRALEYMRAQVDKRTEVEDEEAVAEAVGIAAIFFSDLSNQRIRDYTFSWERAISFEGDTGPYLMNAHARIAGIIRKCGVQLDPAAGVSPLVEPEAHQLVSLVARYTDTLREAAEQYEPSVLARYLLELARSLHASYNVLRVKGEEEAVARARLLLFTVVKQVLASGLRILGIRPLERM